MTGDLANAVPRIRREFDNELGNRITITIDGPTSRSENILTPREATELRNGLDEMEQALAADREKLVALGADPGPTEDEFFSNGIMDLNSALALAEDMTEAPGYGDMQDALGVLANAYRKAEDRIGELIAAPAPPSAAPKAMLHRVLATLIRPRNSEMSLAAQKHDNCPTCRCTDPLPPPMTDDLSASGTPNSVIANAVERVTEYTDYYELALKQPGRSDYDEIEKDVAAFRRVLSELTKAREALAEACGVLKWYQENVAGCRKLGSIGDPFRQALNADGGTLARTFLGAKTLEASDV